MENSTKDRILNEALALFAEKGYKGTNLRDLAARVGLSKSALYKHFDRKEAIWDAVLDKMEAYYIAQSSAAGNAPRLPICCHELLQMTMGTIRFTVYDPLIILCRKVLLTEQFHDERASKLATTYFLESKNSIFARVFENMMANGAMKKDNPAMLSFAYTAPITALVHLSDREPEKKEEIIQRIEAFARSFLASHGLK